MFSAAVVSDVGELDCITGFSNCLIELDFAGVSNKLVTV